MITKKRGLNNNYLLAKDGKIIGETWKCVGSPGFAVNLHGVFWLRGEPNTKHGTTTTVVRRLKDVIPFVEQTLLKVDGDPS